ncbi:MAG: rod shape determining protein RodA, partial [Gammaproteobacteria bacterium]
MSAARRSVGSFDWVLMLLYLALVGAGWLNIYSASYNADMVEFFSWDNLFFKQLVWIGLGILLIVFILFLDTKFFERFSSIIYIVALLSLILLFPLGNTISGATSWYKIGPMSLQPSEFAKAATALALAKYLSDIQTNIKSLRDQIRAFIIIALPALIIIPQPDPGSALVYAAFFFPLYREGLAAAYLIFAFSV